MLDGGHGTSGPSSFKGELGKQLTCDIHLEPVADFEPIESELENVSEDVLNNLSRDENLLYRYSKAIMFGEVPDDLKLQKPGPVFHARWLTLALRILINIQEKKFPLRG